MEILDAMHKYYTECMDIVSGCNEETKELISNLCLIFMGYALAIKIVGGIKNDC